MVTNHKLILEEELIVIDSSDSEVDNRGENPNNKLVFEKDVIVIDSSSEIEENQKDKDFRSESRSDRKVKDREMLADLTLFPGLVAMLAAEASMREKNRRRNQLRRLRKKLSKAYDSEKEKVVNKCEPAQKTVSESTCDGLQPPVESEPCLSSSEGQKVNGDNCWCITEMDSAATEVFLGEEKSNEQDDVVDDSKKEKVVTNFEPVDKTASESACDGLQPPVVFGPHLSSSSGGEVNGDDCWCRVEIYSVGTEVFLGEEKSNEGQDNVVNDSGKEKIGNNFQPAERTVSEASCDGLRDPVEFGPHLSSSSSVGEKVNGDDCWCREDMDSAKTQLCLGEGKCNKEQDGLMNDPGKQKIGNNCQPAERTVSETSCDGLKPPVESGPHLSSPSVGEKVSGDDCWCREEMDSAKTQLCLGEGKSNEEHDGLIREKGEEKLVDSCGDTNRRILVETESMDGKQNMVLQKLLRPPRYFNPPEVSSMCLEGNHGAAPCRKRKRQRPCFICADPGHEWRQCRKEPLQFNNHIPWERRGHPNKDWPQKDVADDFKSKSCLRCGDAGHDMFSCDNTYRYDDLKEIQCYVCKGFGHLCCFNYAAEGPIQASCYTCGKSGHYGSDCREFREKANSTKLATSKHEERSRVNQHLQEIMVASKCNLSNPEKSAEQGDGRLNARAKCNPSIQETSAEQGEGTSSVRSTTHESFGTGNATRGWPRRRPWPRQYAQRTWGWPRTRHNAERQTINMPRRNNVWVRPQTEPNV